MAGDPIENDQKIIYELRPDVDLKKKGELPFVRLLNGLEPICNVKLRYNLYKRNWAKQTKSIDNILNKTDKFIYKSLKTFLCYDDQHDNRLNAGLVHFGSNIANHARLTKNVSESMKNKDEDQIKHERSLKGLPALDNVDTLVEPDKTICLVHLNSTAHTTMESVLRTIENEVMKRISEEGGLGRGKIRRRRVKRYEYNYDSASSDSASEPEVETEGLLIKQEEDDNEKLNDASSFARPNFKFKEDIDEEDMVNFRNVKDEKELLRRSKRLKNLKREQVDDDYSHRLARANKFTDLNDILDLLKSIDVRLIVFIENCDSMNLEIVHRLIKLLWRYQKTMKVGLIIGISTPFEIFEEKLPVLLMNDLRTKTFSIDNSSDAINEIMEDLLLNINDTYNSLIFDPKLVLDFLKRRDNISIIQFYNFMKAIYMNHYFSEPMSIFWTKKFTGIELTSEYFDVFSRLPSVMSCGEDLENDFLKGILKRDINKIGQHLRINLNKLINWRYNFRNIFDFFNYLHVEYLKTNNNKIWDNNLHLFQLIFTNFYEGRKENEVNIEQNNAMEVKKENEDSFEEGEQEEEYEDEEEDYEPPLKKGRFNEKGIQFHKLEFLNPLWLELKTYSKKRIQHIYEEILGDDQFNFITGQDGFPPNIINEINFNMMIKCVKLGVEQQVKDLDLTNQLFKEICVIDTSINEKLNMWFSPPIKDLVLSGLESSKSLLFNREHWGSSLTGVDWEVFKVFEPSMCEIYRNYRDAGIVINVYDFYCVYKESVIDRMRMIQVIINKFKEHYMEYEEDDFEEIMETLKTIRRDLKEGRSEEWDKMMLAWFLKGFQELEILGLIKQNRSKTLSIEKLVWKGV